MSNDEGAAFFRATGQFRPVREPALSDDVQKRYRELCYYVRASRNPDREQLLSQEAAAELLELLEEVSTLLTFQEKAAAADAAGAAASPRGVPQAEVRDLAESLRDAFRSEKQAHVAGVAIGTMFAMMAELEEHRRASAP